jgi:simple sugar transport system permease protein
MGGAVAGLAGYHYFAAVPGLYKISSDYGYFGDLAFYGIICGLISLGDALAAIPVALLFGGLSVGGRYVQGKLHMGFGVDYALLGVLMIALVAFQFFYRYKLVLNLVLPRPPLWPRQAGQAGPLRARPGNSVEGPSKGSYG